MTVAERAAHAREPIFTQGDVEFLRREAERHDRWARTNTKLENAAKAEKLRSLADRIEKRLREAAA